MTDLDRLRAVIEASGITMVALAEKAGIRRETLYNRLNGIGEFKASEIVGLSRVLHLTKPQRDSIFLSTELN